MGNADVDVRRGTSLAHLAVAVLALGAHLAMSLRFWWVTDDAFISLRFARNLAQGAGPRFNLWDQPAVEGYSNFLWVVLAGGLHALGLDMVVWVPIVSFACGAVLLYVLLDRLVRVLDVPLPIAGALVLGLACYPPFAVWTTSGLATMPFALLVFLTFDRLLLARGGPDWRLGSVFGAALALIRIEGIAWVGVVLVLAFLGQVLQRRLALGRLLMAGGIVALVFGVYFAWRYSYYGELLPNTAYAKSVSGPEFLRRGYQYVMANALTFLVPFLIVPGSLHALRRERIAVGVPVAALSWAFPVYAVVVAGDYMPMGRFLIPGLPFATILLAWLLQDIAGRSAWRTRAALALGALVGTVGALPGFDVHVVPERHRAWANYRMSSANNAGSEYSRWVALNRKVKSWRRRGRQIRAFADEMLEPPVSMAIRALGAIGYETDFLMYDCAGLTVPEIARREVTEWRDQPGHDKAVELDYFVDARPTILRVWTFGGDHPEAQKKIRTALAEWRAPDVRKQYRPELVKLIADDDGASVYLLALVYGESVKPRAWRAIERMQPEGLADVREIRY